MYYNDPSFAFLKEKLCAPQTHSFANDRFDDVAAWKDELRRIIYDRLYYTPDSVPLNASFGETLQFDGYTRRSVAFDSAAGVRVPGYLLVPDGLAAPAPAVIALHDHGGMFYWGKEKSVEHKDTPPVLKKYVDTYYDGVPLASGLARHGYVVLVIDSLNWGERRFRLEDFDERITKRLAAHKLESQAFIDEYNLIELELESELVKGIQYIGHTFMGVRTHDDIKSVDYLCGLPEVNPDRIGCIGLSMGGHRAGWLGGLDERIKCSVVVGWMARHKEMIENRMINIPWMWAVPGLYGYADYPDVVSMTVPRKLMLMHGLRDVMFMYETGQKAAETIRQVYKKAGCEENFVPKFYDAPHEFNGEMREDAYAFLDGVLK